MGGVLSFDLTSTEGVPYLAKLKSPSFQPGKESLAVGPKPPEPGAGGPLLVDKYGQVYTDKITSLISGSVVM